MVERAPAVRPGGYAVDFRGASMSVLDRMGLVPQVKKLETRTGAITIVDEANRKVASMPDGFTSGELEIMRGDLAGVFYEATRDATEYIFDDSITAMAERGDGIEVTFSRTGAREFDLVVGADVEQGHGDLGAEALEQGQLEIRERFLFGQEEPERAHMLIGGGQREADEFLHAPVMPEPECG